MIEVADNNAASAAALSFAATAASTFLIAVLTADSRTYCARFWF